MHETGGKYGNGVIVRKYRTGSVIPVRVELTANHHGYFEFRTCAMTYKDKEVDQDCLDQHLLRSKNGSIRYYPGPGNKIFEAFYKLPDDLTCAQCVFQWRYVAGNNWGDCGNGTGITGTYFHPFAFPPLSLFSRDIDAHEIRGSLEADITFPFGFKEVGDFSQ